jgi:hypothetical protein
LEKPSRSSAAAETSKLLRRLTGAFSSTLYNYVNEDDGYYEFLLKNSVSTNFISSVSIRASKPGRLWIGDSKHDHCKSLSYLAPRRTQAIQHIGLSCTRTRFTVLPAYRSYPIGSWIMDHTSCTRPELRRLFTNPMKAAIQAATATIINPYDTGIRNEASTIFTNRYVHTEYMPSGKTPPQ